METKQLSENLKTLNIPENIINLILQNIKILPKAQQTPNEEIGAIRTNYNHFKNLVVVSDKWSNIFFNLKKLFLQISPAVAGVADPLLQGFTPHSILIAILGAIGVWSILIDSRKIELEIRHAVLLKDIGDMCYFGHTYGNLQLLATQSFFDNKGWDLNKTIEELAGLKIIQVSKEPFQILLREKIIINSQATE